MSAIFEMPCYWGHCTVRINSERSCVAMLVTDVGTFVVYVYAFSMDGFESPQVRM